MLPHLRFWPEVIHCNDWQTALVPVYMLEERYHVPELANTKTVFTIHNIEYQAATATRYWRTSLAWTAAISTRGCWLLQGRQPDEGRHHGLQLRHHRLAHLRPGAASALLCPRLGRVINEQSGKLQGILNGIDTQLYDPAATSGLAANFSARSLVKGKAECKLALQRAVGLEENADVPSSPASPPGGPQGILPGH